MKLTYNDTTHSYWLNGKRVKSASKVAKIAAENFTLEQWGLRQIAIGMTLDPTLAERVAVDPDNREAVQSVCDSAKVVAKSHARADRGTQRHRVLELVLLGQEDRLITPQQEADAKVMRRTLDHYGLEPMPDRVEQFVAWPDHGVVGRYDAVLMHEGRPVLTDLKGGINAVTYPHSTAVQEALYAFAPHTSARIEKDSDKSIVNEWTTMPDGLDQEIAYVIYADDEHEVGELWRLNLVHGRKGAELALSIVDWRKAHDYGRGLAARYEAAPPAAPATPDRRTILLERFNDLSPAAQHRFKRLGLPAGELDAITKALDNLTMAVPAEPAPATVDRPTSEELLAFKQRFAELDDTGQKAHQTLAAAIGERLGKIPSGSIPTRHRYNLARASVLLRLYCATTGEDLDDLFRQLVADTNGTDAWTGTTDLADALCALHDDQAAELAATAALIHTGLIPSTHKQETPT